MSLSNKSSTHELRGSSRLTFEQFIVKIDDDFHHELINGVHIIAPNPSLYHQRLSLRIGQYLLNYLDKHPSGKVFVELYLRMSPEVQEHAFKPDIVYYSTSDSFNEQPDHVTGVPSLVVEVLSPPESYRRDYIEKKEICEQYGVKEYWVVNPEDYVVDIFSLEQNKYTGRAYKRGEIIISQHPDFQSFELQVNKLFFID